MTALDIERPDDTAGIRAVHEASFPTSVEARLVEALRSAGRLTISLTARDGGTVVGHVAFSPVTIGDDGPVGLGLGPVAVLPSHRRHGVAAALIREGLARAAQAGWNFVVVLGEPRYYERFGFRPAAAWGLRDEYGGGDAFQALELRPHGVPAGGGVVRYAPEFGSLDRSDEDEAP